MGWCGDLDPNYLCIENQLMSIYKILSFCKSYILTYTGLG